MAPPGRMLTEAGGGVMGEVQRERQAAGRVSPGWGRRPESDLLYIHGQTKRSSAPTTSCADVGTWDPK